MFWGLCIMSFMNSKELCCKSWSCTLIGSNMQHHFANTHTWLLGLRQIRCYLVSSFLSWSFKRAIKTTELLNLKRQLGTLIRQRHSSVLCSRCEACKDSVGWNSFSFFLWISLRNLYLIKFGSFVHFFKCEYEFSVHY